MGSVKKIILKPQCLPSKFLCQTDRKRSLPMTTTSRPAAAKRQRLEIIKEALEESKLETDTDKATTTLSLGK